MAAILGFFAMSGCRRDSAKPETSETNVVSCCSAQVAAPKTAGNTVSGAGNTVDWASIRVTLSDTEIAHFHKRAKDIINDHALWNRLGQKYEGPFEISSEDFGYECERLVQHKATVAVIVPIKKTDFPHAWFVKIVFRQYYRDNPENEIESISVGYWP